MRKMFIAMAGTVLGWWPIDVALNVFAPDNGLVVFYIILSVVLVPGAGVVMQYTAAQYDAYDKKATKKEWERVTCIFVAIEFLPMLLPGIILVDKLIHAGRVPGIMFVALATLIALCVSAVVLVLTKLPQKQVGHRIGLLAAAVCQVTALAFMRFFPKWEHIGFTAIGGCLLIALAGYCTERLVPYVSDEEEGDSSRHLSAVS